MSLSKEKISLIILINFGIALAALVIVFCTLILFSFNRELPSSVSLTSSTIPREDTEGLAVVQPVEPPTVELPAVVETKPPTTEKVPQFVLMAFDGSYSLDMWKDTRAFAQSMIAASMPVHFTYFINAAYYLAPQYRTLYAPPGHPLGASAINVAYSPNDVANRIEQTNLAFSEGHEIGSHSVGHFNGSAWTEDDWTSELTQFKTLLENVGVNNHLDKEPDVRRVLSFLAHGIFGFRAPELGADAAMWKVLAKLGYTYDTSRTTKHPEAWPIKDADGLWSFPLPLIPYNGVDSKLLAMDYNFYYKQTGAADKVTKDMPEWQQYHDEMLHTYEAYFDSNYGGTRAPVFIGHHFSLWNDGAYWEALKDFATEECGKPDVKCVTYSELVDYLNAHPELTAKK